MTFLDSNDPFFRPRWRRWAAVAVPLLWAGVELRGGHPDWAAIFAATGAYAVWMLILRGPDDPANGPPDAEGD